MLESLKFTSVSRRHGILVVGVAGSISTGTCDSLEEDLCGFLREADICLDLRDVDRFSSVGMGMFYRMGDMADELGRRIFILRPSLVVRRGLDASAVDSVFRFIEDEDDLAAYS